MRSQHLLGSAASPRLPEKGKALIISHLAREAVGTYWERLAAGVEVRLFGLFGGAC